MSWRDTWLLYRAEVKAALRERTIVVNSILVPILLYPLIVFLTVTALTFVTARTEEFLTRIELRDLPAEHQALRDRFAEHEHVELVDPRPALEESQSALRQGKLDALVELLPPAPEAASLAGNFAARLTSDSAKDRSTAARRRVEEVLSEYRSTWLDRQASSYGIPSSEWQVFHLSERNLASEAEMGAFILGLMLPIMFVVMVAVGCFYPAVDSTAGERERHTWETTMTLATSRTSIVAAKYLYVATFGCVAGFLNVAAMTVSMRTLVANLFAGAESALKLRVPLQAIPIMVVAAVLLAGFVAAGMMIFASFARNFREGQSMVTPFYLVILLPVLVLNDPGIELTPRLALIPVVNVALVMRDSFGGTFAWLPIALTLVTSLVTIALCVALAVRILRFEDVVTGTYGGNILRFLRERVLRRKGGQR